MKVNHKILKTRGQYIANNLQVPLMSLQKVRFTKKKLNKKFFNHYLKINSPNKINSMTNRFSKIKKISKFLKSNTKLKLKNNLVNRYKKGTITKKSISNIVNKKSQFNFLKLNVIHNKNKSNIEKQRQLKNISSTQLNIQIKNNIQKMTKKQKNKNIKRTIKQANLKPIKQHKSQQEVENKKPNNLVQKTQKKQNKKQNSQTKLPPKIKKHEELEQKQKHQSINFEYSMLQLKELQQTISRTLTITKVKSQKQFYQWFARIKIYLKQSYAYGDLKTKIGALPTHQHVQKISLSIIKDRNQKLEQQAIQHRLLHGGPNHSLNNH